MKKSKDQRMFDRTMNNLLYPIVIVIFVKGFFYLLEILFALFTANRAFKHYGSNIIPSDYMFDRIENIVFSIVLVIASVYFLRGLIFLKQYINYCINKKRS